MAKTSQGRNPAREAELLEAYLTVARAEGVENVTLQKIAKAADVAYSTVHYYFGSGEPPLIDRALAYVASASDAFMEAEQAAAAPDGNLLAAYVDAKFAWGRKFPTYASMLCYFIYQATRDDAARDLSTRLHLATVATVRSLFLQEVGKGRYARVADPEQLARRIVALLGGALLAAATTAVPEAELRDLTMTTIEALIR